MTEPVKDWIGFWDSAHSIYVNQRHFDAHYRDVADHILRLVPREDAVVMDFGCGEATHAHRVAAGCGELWLCESAGTVREHLRARFGSLANLKVAAPEEMDAMPADHFDLIVANSVAQYIRPDDLDRLLAQWRRLLKPGGVLVLADVIPPDAGIITDVFSLLRYAAANGFLLASLGGLVRTAFSPYRRLRSQLGITTYTQQAIARKIEAAGYLVQPLGYNFEHNPARASFKAAKPSNH